MMHVRSISYGQTVRILTGHREIPPDITARVEAMLTEGTPVVDIDRFSAFVASLTIDSPIDSEAIMEAHYQSIVALGSCSLEMAWQQAGDLHLPRPRRLYEHNQSVLNVFGHMFARAFTDHRDRLLRPMLALQDGGKAHAVALADPTDPRRNRYQARQNGRMADNVLDSLPDDVLAPPEKKVIKLLIGQTAIGTALRRHGDKHESLEEVLAPAVQQLSQLREQCPVDYRDRFDDYLLVSYFADAGAHTQRARYIDATTGEARVDVSHEDRFTADGQETGRSLDRIFSEASGDMHTLKLFQPRHLAVMRHLFPDRY